LELNKALGLAIRELRQSKGLSQESIGASQSYISDIERGIKTLSVEKLDEIANCIGVQPVTILAKCYMIKNDSTDSTILLSLLAEELSDLETPNT
jgi:transcriptional regulator with XRE-family HTH domain